MQRIFHRFTCVALLVTATVCAFYMPVQAETVITVTTTGDAIAEDGQCSLREALIAANTDAPLGGCPGGSGADVILFDPALPKPALFVLTQTGVNEDAAQSGDLDILDGLTISGSGAASTIIIDGNGSDRVLHIHSGVAVTIENVSIRHGNPGPGANGGGILTELTARLTISNSQLISNSALSGGAIYGVGRVTLHHSLVEDNSGGGLTNSGGLLTLNDVTVRNNRGGYGVRNQEIGALFYTVGTVENNQSGGIYNGRASANLSHIKIASNGGSGIYSTGEVLTRLTISQSQILSNTAASGAGISSQGVGARATILDTQISHNMAANAGGGIFNNSIMEISGSTLDHNAAAAGGGLQHFGGTLTLTNSTLSQNSAGDNGGGLYIGASATVKSSTLYANRAEGSGSALFVDESELIMGNTIVARADMAANCANSSGVINSAGYNLDSGSSCSFSATGDQSNSDPKLAVLAHNGGATPTHALLSGSPAIDQGDATSCPATDQRGLARPQGPQCDIGALEAGDVADLHVALTASAASVDSGEQLTYQLALTNLGPNSATSITLTNQLPLNVGLISTTVTATVASAISTTLVENGDCASTGCLRWTFPSMAAGEHLTATIAITAPATSGVLTNTARVASRTADLNTENNARTVWVAVTQPGSDQTAPGPVGNLTSSQLTATGVTLNWTPSSDNVGVTGYHIWVQKDGPAATPVQMGATEALSFTLDSLEPGTGYRLWVAAFDGAGNEAALSELAPLHVTTLAVLGVIRIVVEPPAPTVSDTISITVSSIHRDSCVPQYDSHQVGQYEIHIVSIPSGELFCTPAEIPWSYSINVGPLAAGAYTITHTLEQQQTHAYFDVRPSSTPAPTPTPTPLPTHEAKPTATAEPTAPATPVPAAPQIVDPHGQSTKEATAGQLFQYTLQATGFPPPTFALVSAPQSMTINAATGQIDWTPMASEAGLVSVTVRATNNLGSSNYTFDINVRAAHAEQQSGPHSYLPIVQK